MTPDVWTALTFTGLGFIVALALIPPLIWRFRAPAPKPPINLAKGTADEWPLSDI